MADRDARSRVLAWLLAHPDEPFKFFVLGADRLVGGYRCGDEIHLYSATLNRESIHRADGTLVLATVYARASGERG
jgi:hypothetical protein